ncbi:hypothetical protein EW146_g9416 [Bondarzewia mesenterica]|uniref:Uncharacterized protein n=1 Tax=Bondarzewia mesenterica TaxID=1095465 RepID=A0A4S4L6T2_9AGAM|nr:hypothetical protein EW146_g9416 [Bondarzewia mesenterica]
MPTTNPRQTPSHPWEPAVAIPQPITSESSAFLSHTLLLERDGRKAVKNVQHEDETAYRNREVPVLPYCFPHQRDMVIGVGCMKYGSVILDTGEDTILLRMDLFGLFNSEKSLFCHHSKSWLNWRIGGAPLISSWSMFHQSKKSAMVQTHLSIDSYRLLTMSPPSAFMLVANFPTRQA